MASGVPLEGGCWLTVIEFWRIRELCLQDLWTFDSLENLTLLKITLSPWEVKVTTLLPVLLRGFGMRARPCKCGMVKSDGGTSSFNSHLGFDEVDLCSNIISLGMLNPGVEPSL